MWPFIKNKKSMSGSLQFHSTAEPDPPRRPLSLEKLVEGIGGCEDLADNDVALKFWLPEPGMQALKELADICDQNMSRMLREFLLTHCYGVYAIEWLRELHPRLFRDASRIRFSVKSEELPPGKVRIHTYWVPELGKNIAPMKIWIPARLKEDLGILAEHAELTVSNYVREIVISRFLGHGTLPMRPKMLDVKADAVAEDWNEDRGVPWREVSKAEYQRASVGKSESQVVDDL